jgi:hypothetical protein
MGRDLRPDDQVRRAETVRFRTGIGAGSASLAGVMTWESTLTGAAASNPEYVDKRPGVHGKGDGPCGSCFRYFCCCGF